MRKIIHIDMDAFYAAVEQRDFPEYRNKPLIVGGSPFSRGVVATCSYEARPFGIHSAMPASRAYRLCPDAIFVKPRFDVYREVSLEIRRIMADYTDLIEPLSLDEAYLDVSTSTQYAGSATLIAKEIKTRIKQVTQLTASAGVSYNKFLAKIASDLDKPDGLHVIKPNQAIVFIKQLPIHKFHGVGNATAQKMRSLGIQNGKGLQQRSLIELQQHFGKSGLYYYNIARGIDNRPVISHRSSRSISVETTFAQDIIGASAMLNELQQLFAKALNKVTTKELKARTVTVKIKYHDFVQITRSRTLNQPVNAETPHTGLLMDLLKTTEIDTRAVRLLGVTLSSFEETLIQIPVAQTDLFN
ncbi:MAG: DNA polymerase IV [Gammaproteobacteria bacterium]|nr:DNA polymerase IV [Gammaproteobacteria bacterium]